MRIPGTTASLKEKVLEIIEEDPTLVETCAARLVRSSTGRRCLGALVESIGEAFARRLIRSLREEDWAAIDRDLRRNLDRDAAVDARDLEGLLQSLVWERLSMEDPAHREPTAPAPNPYAFLDAFLEARSDTETLARLRAEDPRDLAWIASCWSADAFGTFLDRVFPEGISAWEPKRRAALLHAASREDLPLEARRSAALAYADRLENRLEGRMEKEAEKPAPAPKAEATTQSIPVPPPFKHPEPAKNSNWNALLTRLGALQTSELEILEFLKNESPAEYERLEPVMSLPLAPEDAPPVPRGRAGSA